jgi:hypothetical protein
MPHQNKARRAGGAAGLDRNCSSQDNSENSQTTRPTQAQNDVRLRFLAGRLHTLGPKPLYYFLREIEAGAGIRPHLELYARLPDDFIAAHGGDRFEPNLLAIDGGVL